MLRIKLMMISKIYNFFQTYCAMSATSAVNHQLWLRPWSAAASTFILWAFFFTQIYYICLHLWNYLGCNFSGVSDITDWPWHSQIWCCNCSIICFWLVWSEVLVHDLPIKFLTVGSNGKFSFLFLFRNWKFLILM